MNNSRVRRGVRGSCTNSVGWAGASGSRAGRHGGLGTTAVAVAALLGSAGGAGAQLTVYEEFNYSSSVSDGSSLSGSGGSSAGWSGAWGPLLGSGAGVNFSTTGMTYKKLYDSLTVVGGSATVHCPPLSSGAMRRNLSTALGANGTVWMSFLIQQTAGDQPDTSLGIKLPVSGTGDYVFFGKPINQTRWCAQWHSATPLADIIVPSSTSTYHQVLYLVRFDFYSGNSPVAVWINPQLNWYNSGTITAPADSNAIHLPSEFMIYLTSVILEGSAPQSSHSIDGTIDEIRFAAGDDGYRYVLPFVPKLNACQNTEHGLSLESAPGYSLEFARVQDWWDLKAKARTRRCHHKDPESGGWTTIPSVPGPGPRRLAEAWGEPNHSNSSHAVAAAQVNISTWNLTQLDLTTSVTHSAHASTQGCPKGGLKRGRAKAKTEQKVRIEVPGGPNYSGNYGGNFYNSACESDRKKVVRRDPLDLVVTDQNNVTTRYPIVDIWSAVGATGFTRWAERADYCDIGVGGACIVLENTAPDMTFRAEVGSAAIPLNQRGTLLIEAHNNHIVTAYSDGIFAGLTNGISAPIKTTNSTANFTVFFPPISITPQVSGTPVSTALDFGGSALGDSLPDSAVEIGCEITNGLDNGFDAGTGRADTSSPEAPNTSVGFPVDSTVQLVAQPFTVPANVATMNIESIGIPVYQTGMPTGVDPTTPSVNVTVWDRNPALSGAMVLYAGQATTENDWADVDACASAGTDDGTNAVIDLIADLPSACILGGGGTYWLVVGVNSDPNYPPARIVPCRDHLTSGNAWCQNVSTGQWAPLLDAGSSQQASLPFDIYASECAAVTPIAVPLGPIPDAGLVRGDFLGPAQVKWYSFSIAGPAEDAARTYLDIDTEGSPRDVSIALFDSFGNFPEDMFASDGDSGSGTNDQLTFGIGRRPAVGDGRQYDGRHGQLAEGTYYLAVGPVGTTFGPCFVANPSNGDGQFNLRIRTNVNGGPLAPSIPPLKALDLGTLTAPGGAIPADPMSAYEVKWYSFSTCVDADETDRYSIDMTGTIAPSSAMHLFDSAGNLVARSVSTSSDVAEPMYFITPGSLPAGGYYLALSYGLVETAPSPASDGRWHLRDVSSSDGFFFTGHVTATNAACGAPCGTADFNGDGDIGTDADIEAFFACLGGNCCVTCDPHGADFNGDGDVGTDADIESFFRVLAGGPC